MVSAVKNGWERKLISTKCEQEADAREWSLDWVLNAKGRLKLGKTLTGKSFRKVALDFIDYEQAQKGHLRHRNHIKYLRHVIHRWFIPYFQDEQKLTIEEIRAKDLDDFVVWRNKQPKGPNMLANRPAPQTLKNYMVAMRRIMKYAVRQGLIDTLPLFPEIARIKHTRGWFEPQEYEHLKKVSRERIASATNITVRRKRECLHQYIILRLGVVVV